MLPILLQAISNVVPKRKGCKGFLILWRNIKDWSAVSSSYNNDKDDIRNQTYKWPQKSIKSLQRFLSDALSSPLNNESRYYNLIIERSKVFPQQRSYRAVMVQIFNAYSTFKTVTSCPRSLDVANSTLQFPHRCLQVVQITLIFAFVDEYDSWVTAGRERKESTLQGKIKKSPNWHVREFAYASVKHKRNSAPNTTPGPQDKAMLLIKSPVGTIISR